MNLTQSITGMMTIELTSAAPYTRLQELAQKGIAVYGIQKIGDLTISFQLDRRNYPSLVLFAKKHSERVKVLSYDGWYWNIPRFFSRPALVVGFLVLVFLVCFLPTRVLFFRVEGNQTVPEKQILDSAFTCGIRFGASRRSVRSEKVKNSLLAMVPELQWAGVNTKGCLAIISVQERSNKNVANPSSKIGNVVAARDGVIVSATVTKGQGVCAVGQAVQKGDLLISGVTDCGISSLGTKASGEIMARTQRDITVLKQESDIYRSQINGYTKRYSLQFQKKRINFYKGSGIYPPGCVKMYEEYYMTLPGGFRLPICLKKETIVHYNTLEQPVMQESNAAFLRSFTESYLLDHMISGAIDHKTEYIAFSNGVTRLVGRFFCTEMIGRETLEMLGDFNDETD